MAGIQKTERKLFKLCNGFIAKIAPKEGLLEGLVFVVGIILRVHTVADHENLNVLE